MKRTERRRFCMEIAEGTENPDKNEEKQIPRCARNDNIGTGTGEEKNMSYTVAKGNQRADADQVEEAGKIPAGVVDLRSDTVTRPTAEMRRGEAEGEVGDGGDGEKPTGHPFGQSGAGVFGEEAAVVC